ncbi:MAG: hypothetical protein HRU03_01845 [Nanoarchaeales archaeon]|nr:hypothetical protein [Nanoarchaeales archaeon]
MEFKILIGLNNGNSEFEILNTEQTSKTLKNLIEMGLIEQKGDSNSYVCGEHYRGACITTLTYTNNKSEPIETYLNNNKIK